VGQIIGVIIFILIIIFVKYLYNEYKAIKDRDTTTIDEKKTLKNKAVILDTETTGLSKDDEIIELALMLVEFNKNGELELIDEYIGLREPKTSIHPKARLKHGLNQEKLKNKVLDHKKCYDIFDKAEFFVAHNASFDKKFLNKLFSYLTDDYKLWLCSCRDIDWRSFGFGNAKLEELVEGHNISFDGAHRAGNDTRALLELLNQKDDSGITYFKKLLVNNNVNEENIKW